MEIPIMLQQLNLMYTAAALLLLEMEMELETETESEDDDNDQVEAGLFEIPLDINTFSKVDCRKRFRFTMQEIREITALLKLPERIRTPEGDNESREEALAYLLAYLSHLSQHRQLEKQFNTSRVALVRILRYMVTFIAKRWSAALTFDAVRINGEKRMLFARKIQAHGSPLSSCLGFIDEPARSMTRSGNFQRIAYNGHVPKYQGVVTPDGIIVDLKGPFEGRTYDFMYTQSGLMDTLREHAWSPQGNPMYIFGDPEYGCSRHIISMFKDNRQHGLTKRQKAFNHDMSRCREPVEWAFGKIVEKFALVDFQNQRLWPSSIAHHYFCAVLLTNIHSCYYGNRTSMCFDVEPPTIQEYLRPELYQDIEL